MNIWCISKYAAPPKYNKMPARLFEFTKEFNKLGFNARLITSDSNHLAKFPNTIDRYVDEVIETVPVRWVKTRKYGKTASIDRVLSWLDFEWKLFYMPTDEFESPNVVLISSLSIFTILYGYYLKRKYNSLLVFEIRDIWPLSMTEEGGFSRWHPLVLLIGMVEKFGYKKADLIVGTMPKLDLHVEKILGYKKPFHCSPMGFNPLKYGNEKNDSSLNRFGFPEKGMIVGYAGSIGITNSLQNFIDAIKLLQGVNIYFVIVGSGDLKSDYQEQLSGFSNVRFLPRIEQDEVNIFLHSCDILYLSTHDSEVWEYGQSMNKVVEYMLSGKPIVASYSGYPSMINESGCGTFVRTKNPKDLMKVFMSMANMTSEDRRQLGEKGREWIYKNRKYSVLANSYIEAIRNLSEEK